MHCTAWACHGRSGAVYPWAAAPPAPCGNILETLRDAIDLALPLGLGKIPYGPQQVMFLQADITQLAADTGFTPRTALCRWHPRHHCVGKNAKANQLSQ